MNEVYRKILDEIQKYGSTREDAFRGQLPCSSGLICDTAIIAPYWRPDMFRDSFDSIDMIVDDRIWTIKAGDEDFTYLRTEIGAPRIGDTTLALGLSNCRNLLFIGSVGALSPEMNIGDLVVPEYSVAGDGFSRYLTTDNLKNSDCLSMKAYPDKQLTKRLRATVSAILEKHGHTYHNGNVFSIDTIFAQFMHLDEILDMGCNCIEMETAAFFKAAKTAGIRAAALLQVSDNTVNNKSLYSGRTRDDHTYRWKVRREIVPAVIKDFMGF